MRYTLKKTKLKKGLYLQIYKGEYDPATKNNRNTSYRTLGYLDELAASGIENPIEYFQKEVDELNAKERLEKESRKGQKVSDRTPIVNAGYFPMKKILDGYGLKKYMDLYQQINTDFRFNLYELLSALVFARLVQPGSKRNAYTEVIPQLGHEYDFSYDQILAGCEFIGSEYEKFIEIASTSMAGIYGSPTDHVFFDCTNFYFEIDREDEFRRKGPSKENRKDPIVGMGLILDSNMVPIGMKMYPGNESEKPVLRDVIRSLKERNHIEGKTVQVADKGLNCAQNIYAALSEGDGYIFSKSVKQLDAREKVWVTMDADINDEKELFEAGWTNINDSEGNLRYRYKMCLDEFNYAFTAENGERIVFRAGERRVLTYNPVLARKQRAEIEKMVEKAINMSQAAAKRSEYGECSKYVVFMDDNDRNVRPRLNVKQIEKDRELCGYNLIVTSELDMEPQKIYSVYHNLWRIEETFRTLKSQLEARPVYLQKVDSIIGHFTINFIAVQLLRVLQFHVLNNKFCTEEIMRFVRDFTLVKTGDRSYMNLSKRSNLLTELSKIYKIPLDNAMLGKAQINLMNL